MKSLITFLFIIVASTTYRCGKEEETIDCVAATAQMIGSWDVTLIYTNPPTAYFQGLASNTITGAIGTTHKMVLDITETSQCNFIGTMTYGTISNNTSCPFSIALATGSCGLPYRLPNTSACSSIS